MPLPRPGLSASKLLYELGLQKLGYWTDNGAYFMLFDWQFSYPDLYPSVVPTSKQFSSAGGVAERALLLMSAYFADLGVPIGYWQLDAWWYEMPCSCAGRCCGATSTLAMGDTVILHCH